MSEIKACIDLHSISDRKDFVYMIYTMDKEFLSLMAEKRKEQEDKEERRGR